MPIDSRAVMDASAAFYHSFESRDIAVMEQIWKTDGAVTCAHPGWEPLIGWPAIRKSWESIFRGAEVIRIAVTNHAVHAGEPWAWHLCTEHLLITSNGQVIESAVLATNIFEHTSDGLRMIHHHGSPIASRPPQTLGVN